MVYYKGCYTLFILSAIIPEKISHVVTGYLKVITGNFQTHLSITQSNIQVLAQKMEQSIIIKKTKNLIPLFR